MHIAAAAGAVGVVAFGAASIGLVMYGAAELTRVIRAEPDTAPADWALPEPEQVLLEDIGQPRLHAWWMRSPTATASIVVCHGHGGSKSASLWMAAGLYPHYNVLLVDLRGHGESEGNAISVGYLERLDIIRGVRWASVITNRQPVGIFGLSMGAAAAILAAADEPLIAAVVADSPFARLQDSVRLAILGRGYPRVVARVYPPLIQRAAGQRLGIGARRWPDPLDVVGSIAPRPLLIMHGEADRVTTIDGARALYAKAGEPRELWTEPDVEHGQLSVVYPEEYGRRVRTFFDTWLLGSTSGTSH